MDPFVHNMDKGLQKLAADIIPSDTKLKEANGCADKVIKLLHARSEYKIAAVCMAGSSGKKTTIIGSDIDCVLFINNERPPFKDVLEDFENILTLTDSFNITDVRKTRYSIQFRALGFEFDILPAVNFTEGLQLGGDQLIDRQEEQVLRIIKQDPEKYGYMYSSSLAYSSIRFMKQQDGFVNEMVRIAKFWYKTLHFNDYVSGAKNCIELIAVYAAIQEEKMDTNSYLRTFKRFITLIEKFDDLDIYFENNEHQILEKGRPRVMDPVNPYNNLARNWDQKTKNLLKGYANESNQRLKFLANLLAARLDELFVPQPVYRVDLRGIFEHNPAKSQWLISSTTYNSLQPDLKVRNERFHKEFMLMKRLEIFQQYFQFAIYASKASGYDKNQILGVVQNTISRQICDTELKWCSNEYKHEDYDITFTIPTDSTNAMRISYRL